MGVLSTSDFYKGAKIIVDGEIWEILEYERSKMAQRRAVVRTKLRNIMTGAVQDMTFTSGETFETPEVELRTMQFLYADDIAYHFMDKETYEQYPVSPELVGEACKFLKEQQEVKVQFHNGKPIGIELPNVVELEVTHTEPGIKGDTVSATTKPATLETGAVVLVPLFIEPGTIIKVDTRSGKYLERVKKK